VVGERFRGVLVEVLLALFAVPAHGVVGASIAHPATYPSGQLEHGSIVVTAGRVIVTVATLKKKSIPSRIFEYLKIQFLLSPRLQARPAAYVCMRSSVGRLPVSTGSR